MSIDTGTLWVGKGKDGHWMFSFVFVNSVLKSCFCGLLKGDDPELLIESLGVGGKPNFVASVSLSK